MDSTQHLYYISATEQNLFSLCMALCGRLGSEQKQRDVHLMTIWSHTAKGKWLGESRKWVRGLLSFRQLHSKFKGSLGYLGRGSEGGEREQEETRERQEVIHLSTSPKEVPTNSQREAQMQLPRQNVMFCTALDPSYFTAVRARCSPTVNRQLSQQPAASQAVETNGSTIGVCTHRLDAPGTRKAACGLLPTCFSKPLQQVALDIHRKHTRWDNAFFLSSLIKCDIHPWTSSLTNCMSEKKKWLRVRIFSTD